MNRRILALVTAAILLFGLVGCGKNASDGPPAQTPGGTGTSGSAGGTTTGAAGGATGGTTGGAAGGTGGTQANPTTPGGGAGAGSTTPAPPPGPVSIGPLKVGESAQVGPLTVTLKAIEIVSEAAGLAPGYIHAMAQLDVKNEGTSGYTINVTEHFRMETPEGKKANYNMQAAVHRSPKLSGTVDPGNSAEGWLGHLSKKVEGTYKYQFIHPDYGDATWEFSL